jgi:NAD(P)H-dependent FMN reductase
MRRAVRKLKAADAIVVGTPSYGTNSSPATQQLLIRLEHDRREKGDTRLAGKPAVVVAGPRDSGTKTVVAGVRKRLEAQGMAVIGVLECGAPGDEEGPVDDLVEALLAALSEPIA